MSPNGYHHDGSRRTIGSRLRATRCMISASESPRSTRIGAWMFRRYKPRWRQQSTGKMGTPVRRATHAGAVLKLMRPPRKSTSTVAPRSGRSENCVEAPFAHGAHQTACRAVAHEHLHVLMTPRPDRDAGHEVWPHGS